jgi:mono/diheme cytochrome c family protein
MTRAHVAVAASMLVLVVPLGCRHLSTKGVPQNSAVRTQSNSFSDDIRQSASAALEEGRNIYRHDTFGDEYFWGDTLQLHRAIAGERHGGVGPGLTPRQALQLGLKVDVDHVPRIMGAAIRGGSASLDEVQTTLELLKADAVVGVKAFYDSGGLRPTRIGITCALCHSTVNDALTKGIGNRLDGWPNRDLDVGAIVALAPNLSPFEKALGLDAEAIRKALRSWGPGKYDAELIHDGKAYRPDGKSAATLLPAAFGLAGVNLHTYTGWGSITHWNAYVAVTQMHGRGRFFDPRLNDPAKYPVAQRTRMYDVRATPDQVTPKLAALHYYQMSIPAPTPPANSFDRAAADRGRALFEGQAKCASCHVPPLFVEPGWPMHTAAEIGIDDFQAKRSPDERYRTTPLKGLFVRAKGGFYHDGRFATLDDVVNHYDEHLKLGLTAQQKRDLVEYLKSL